jgi:ABC-type bacteriocin/lantibiotic exporter with double-glycine peptidase domain
MFQASSVIGVINNEQFLCALGFFVILFLIISLSFKALTTYSKVRFVQMLECSIGKRLLQSYLCQSYNWFLNSHSNKAKGNGPFEVFDSLGFSV